MSRKQLSASGVSRTFHCTYWLRPDVEWTSSPPDSSTNLGSAFHEAAELYGKKVHFSFDFLGDKWELSESRRDDLFVRYKHFVKWYDGWIKDKDPSKLRFELALAYNPSTHIAKVLTPKGPRDYSEASPDDVCMTADLVYLHDVTPIVVDYKTGVYPVKPTSAQLQTLSLAVAALENKEEVESGVLTVHNDSAKLETNVLSPIHFSEHRRHLQSIPHNISLVDNVPKPGDHCKFCPAISVCPAMIEQMTSVVEDMPNSSPLAVRSPFKFEPTVRSPEHLKWLTEAKNYATQVIDRVDQAMRAYADANGGNVDLGDGTAYGYSYQQMEKPDLTSEQTIQTLVQNGAAGALKYEYKTTWEKLKEVLGKSKYEEVRTLLRNTGGTKVSTIKKYGRFKKSKQLGE